MIKFATCVILCKKQIIALIVLNVYELSENRVDVRFALHATEKIGSLIPYGKENEPLYCSADGKFHNVQNTAYSLTVPGIETYLRKTEEDSGFQHGLSLRRTEDKYRLGIY